MNIFVTSDTHGYLARAVEMYEMITGERKESFLPEGQELGKLKSGIPHIEKFDLMVHAGDLKPDAFKLKQELGLETHAVFGNCDGVMERLTAGHDFDTFMTPAGKALVTHGDLEDINTDLDRLLYLADQEGCNIAFFGHSHVPVFKEIDGITVVNPGSPTKPLDGTRLGSVAYVKADENGYTGEIVYYEDLFE